MGRAVSSMEIAMLPRQLALIVTVLCLVNGTGEHQGGLPAADSGDVDLTVPMDGDEETSMSDEFPTPFHRIRHIAVSYQANENPADSRLDCEDLCAQNTVGCKSFSFRARDNKCLTSPYSLDYSSGWTLHLKTMAMGAVGLMKHTGEWTKFTNVKFVDQGENMGKQAEGDEQSCRSTCNDDENCGAYSYNPEKEECYIGSDGVQFDPEYNYYEKNVPKTSVEKTEEKESEEGKKLPETEEEVEEEKKPRIKMPQDADLEEKLQATAERIKRINQESGTPQDQFDPSPAKEDASKEVIKDRELRNRASVREQRDLGDKTYRIYSKIQQVEQEIRNTEKQGADNIKQIAKKAFDSGYDKALASGQIAFSAKKEQLTKQFLSETTETGSSDNVEEAGKKAREKRAKSESQAQFEAKSRAKEVTDKRSKHEEAIALSQKVSSLISSESATKAQQQATIEAAEKDKQKQDSEELATASGERGEKANLLMVAKGAQGAQMKAFNLKRAEDMEQQTQAEIEFAKRETVTKNEMKKRQENKQKQMEETSGVRERGGKDEAAAALIEKAARKEEMAATKEKIHKLQNPNPTR